MDISLSLDEILEKMTKELFFRINTEKTLKQKDILREYLNMSLSIGLNRKIIGPADIRRYPVLIYNFKGELLFIADSIQTAERYMSLSKYTLFNRLKEVNLKEEKRVRVGNYYIELYNEKK